MRLSAKHIGASWSHKILFVIYHLIISCECFAIFHHVFDGYAKTGYRWCWVVDLILVWRLTTLQCEDGGLGGLKRLDTGTTLVRLDHFEILLGGPEQKTDFVFF